MISFCLLRSAFSGGSYLSSVGSILIGKPEPSVAPAMYSTPPNFHSPAQLTNTDHKQTLLCLKLQSLLRKLRALWKLQYNEKWRVYN